VKQEHELFDELDIGILRHLTADGRASFTDIANELGVSHQTIHNRFDKMVQDHDLRIIGWSDPSRIGLTAGALYRLSVEPRGLKDITTRLASMPEVTWLGLTTGEFSLIGDIWCRDMLHLRTAVSELQSIDGIASAEFAVISRLRKVATLPYLMMLYGADSGDRSKESGTATSAQGIDDSMSIWFHIPQERTASDDFGLDKLDLAILGQLTKDGRESFTTIARTLDVARATVRRRYRRMISENLLKITCWLDPSRVGFHAGVRLDIAVASAYLEEAVGKMLRFPEVAWLAQALGEFNVAADVWCPDLACLNEFLEQLRDVPGVERMEVAYYQQYPKVTSMPVHLLDSE
jgi:Lrp/AsnC family transcriptional regulator for asnA, asnC and gidA